MAGKQDPKRARIEAKVDSEEDEDHDESGEDSEEDEEMEEDNEVVHVLSSLELLSLKLQIR